MARVALVTGGTRGIGRAISLALKKANYVVAANYGGNDATAKAFTQETGVPAYKFDVSDYPACDAAVKKIPGALRPIHVLVNHTRITRDSTVHRMATQHSPAVIQT